MADRFPPLPKLVVLVDKSGAATMIFSRWWQKFADAIEASITSLQGVVDNISDILVQLGLVETTADGALALAESAIKPGGAIKDGKVTTEAMVAGAVTVPSTSAIADTYVPAGATVIVHTTGPIVVGDVTDGGAFIMAFGEIDSGTEKDVGGRINLYVDSGTGFAFAGTGSAGIVTTSGDSLIRATVMAAASIAGAATIQVRLEVVSFAMAPASAKAFTFRSPQIPVMGGKR